LPTEAVVNQESSHRVYEKNQKADIQALKNVSGEQDLADPDLTIKRCSIFFFHGKLQ
jgi:hypothetical protein